MNRHGSTSTSRMSLLAIAGCLGLMIQPSPSFAQEPVDNRSGTVRIHISLATSAMTKLVAAFRKHFPNLKIEFVRAGSVETVKRFVAERQAGRIGTDLIHG